MIHLMGSSDVAAGPGQTMSTRGRPPAEGSDLLTVAEVAALWRVSKMTIYRMVHSGQLAAIRVGRSFHIPRAAVEAFKS
jgi:excisionase family DNA binding protein